MTEKVLTGVGATLKREREAAGLAIADVAEQLKLLPRQIESLENEHFERLPGPSIARGMVRNYARLLGLDPEALLERMAPRAETGPAERGQRGGRPADPLPPPAANRSSTLLYAGFSVALLVLIGLFFYDWQREGRVKPVAPEPMAPPPRAAAVTPAPESAVEKPMAPPVEKPPVSESPQVATVPDKPEREVPAKPSPSSGAQRLVLRMEEEAWLEVRDGSGRSLVSSLHPAGSERAVRGQPPFELVIGNAAHVRLTYDGKPVDLKPHTRGEVARLTLK